MTTFLVVALKTQVLTVTANAQNTFYNISREGGLAPPPCPCLQARMLVGIYTILKSKTRLASDPRQTARVYVYFRSRDKDDEHTIPSTPFDPP